MKNNTTTNNSTIVANTRTVLSVTNERVTIHRDITGKLTVISVEPSIIPTDYIIPNVRPVNKLTIPSTQFNIDNAVVPNSPSKLAKPRNWNTAPSISKFDSRIHPYTPSVLAINGKQRYYEEKPQNILIFQFPILYAFIIGSMLGDACCRFPFNSLAPSIEWGFGSERGYACALFYIQLLLQAHLTRISTPSLSNRGKLDTKGNELYSFKAASIVHPAFEAIQHIFYRPNPISGKLEKIVPLDIEDHMQWESIASLVMDDGSLKGGTSTILCTDSFTLVEVMILQRALRNKFGLEFKPFYNGLNVAGNTKWRLRCNRLDSMEISKQCSKFVHPNIQYKIYKDNN